VLLRNAESVLLAPDIAPSYVVTSLPFDQLAGLIEIDISRKGKRLN